MQFAAHKNFSNFGVRDSRAAAKATTSRSTKRSRDAAPSLHLPFGILYSRAGAKAATSRSTTRSRTAAHKDCTYRLAFATAERALKLRQVAALKGVATQPQVCTYRWHSLQQSGR